MKRMKVICFVIFFLLSLQQLTFSQAIDVGKSRDSVRLSQTVSPIGASLNVQVARDSAGALQPVSLINACLNTQAARDSVRSSQPVSLINACLGVQAARDSIRNTPIKKSQKRQTKSKNK